MSGTLLFLVGTVAIWTGWICLGIAVYRAVESLSKPAGVARSRSVKALGSAAITAAAAFLIGAALPMSSGRNQVGINLPVFWPVMPFAAWGVLFCIAFALTRLYQILLEGSIVGSGSSVITALQRDRYRAWQRQAFLSLGAGVLFFYFFKKSGDTIYIVKGAVPFSPTIAMALGLLAVAAIIFMALAGRAAATRGLAKKVVLHIALLIGSLIFGLPFFWLVITSFKEDLDMSSANGLVWIPKVSETVPYRDPQNAYYQGTYQGETVQADVIEREPNGNLRLNIAEPRYLQGATFEASPNQLKEIDRQIPVMTGTYLGQAYVGKVIKQMNDGRQMVSITSPPQLSGLTYVANPADLEPVRHPGLNWKNYPDSLDYLPHEANHGLTYLENTLILVFFSVIGTIVSSSLVAYGFSRLRFPGKNMMFVILISTMMLPAAVTLLPTFLIFKSLGWIDTLYPLWVPSFFASAFNVFLLRQFFMTIPKELEDASKIDGCSFFKTFWSIMIPQIKPALAVIAIWTFMGVWNNFMGPLVYINSPEHMPISYAVQLFQGDHNGEPRLLMAFATMSMIPVLLLFFVAQRYFIEGVTLSGLGGR